MTGERELEAILKRFPRNDAREGQIIMAPLAFFGPPLPPHQGEARSGPGEWAVHRVLAPFYFNREYNDWLCLREYSYYFMRDLAKTDYTGISALGVFGNDVTVIDPFLPLPFPAYVTLIEIGHIAGSTWPNDVSVQIVKQNHDATDNETRYLRIPESSGAATGNLQYAAFPGIKLSRSVVYDGQPGDIGGPFMVQRGSRLLVYAAYGANANPNHGVQDPKIRVVVTPRLESEANWITQAPKG